jgi:hypothetical protein
MKRFLLPFFCLFSFIVNAQVNVIHPPSGNLRVEGGIIVTNPGSGLFTNIIGALANKLDSFGGNSTNIASLTLTNNVNRIVLTTAGGGAVTIDANDKGEIERPIVADTTFTIINSSGQEVSRTLLFRLIGDGVHSVSFSVTGGSIVWMTPQLSVPENNAVVEYSVTIRGSTAYAGVCCPPLTNAEIPVAIDAVKIADGSVSNVEFETLDGVSGPIQAQLDSKASLASLVGAPAYSTNYAGADWAAKVTNALASASYVIANDATGTASTDITLAAGKVLEFQAGTYALGTKSILFNNRTTIRGFGTSTILGSSGLTNVVIGRQTASGNVDDVTMEKFSMLGTSGTSQGTAIELDSARNATLRDLKIDAWRGAANTGKGISFKASTGNCWKNTIDNVEIDNTDIGIYLTGGSAQSTQFNTFSNLTFGHELYDIYFDNSFAYPASYNSFGDVYVQYGTPTGSVIYALSGAANTFNKLFYDGIPGTNVVYFGPATSANMISYSAMGAGMYVNAQTGGAPNQVWNAGIEYHSPLDASGKAHYSFGSFGSDSTTFGITGGSATSDVHLWLGNTTSANPWDLNIQASATPYFSLSAIITNRLRAYLTTPRIDVALGTANPTGVGLGGVVNSSVSVAQNGAGALTNLSTWTIAGAVSAQTLLTDGDYLEFSAGGRFATNANNKRILALFSDGSTTTTALDTLALQFNGTTWSMSGRIYRTSSTGCIVESRFESSGGALAHKFDRVTLATTWVANNTLIIASDAATTAGDIFRDTHQLKYWPAK